MSFVYAEKRKDEIGEEIIIYSDTKTELIGAYKSNWSVEAYKLISRYGFTKCINICPSFSISFAGNDTAFAHNLLNWMAKKGKFDEEDAVKKAYEIHKTAGKDKIEFIICYADDDYNTHIVCIKDNQLLKDVSSAWIGSPKAFNKLQQIRFETGFPKITTLEHFRRTVEECEDDSVGGFIICDKYDANYNEFYFIERLEAFAERPQFVPAGGIIQFNRTADTGDCTIHFIPATYDVIIEFHQNSTILLYTNRYRYSEKDTNNNNTNRFLLPMLIDAKTNKAIWV